MLCMIDVIVMCVYIFLQRVDEALDVAGEDSSQAKEAVPGDTAEEGKPSSKLNPFVLHFYFLMYHVMYHYLLHQLGWDDSSCIRRTTTYPFAYLFGKNETKTPMILMYYQDRA